MRNLWPFFLSVIAIGCGHDPDTPPAPASNQEAAVPAPATTTAGPWRITVEVDPGSIGPLATSVESLDAHKPHPGSGPHALVSGKLRFENTGADDALLFPIDNSAFSGDNIDGDQLLITEGQCGWGIDHPGAPVEPGACTLALLPPTRIEPGATESRSFFLHDDLSGMAPLEAGRYEFPRTVRYRMAGEARHGDRSSLVVHVGKRER